MRPVGLDLVRKPELAHLVLEVAVPLPYGPLVLEEIKELVMAALYPASELVMAVAAAFGVAVTVTVERATVTVTGAQLPPPLPAPPVAPTPDAPAAPEPAAPVGTGTTVTYLVDVKVPEMVVVDEPDREAPPAPELGPVAYSVWYAVAVEVRWIVVVTTVADEPLPSVYVRVELVTVPAPVPVAWEPPAVVTPVPRGTETPLDAGLDEAGPYVGVAIGALEYVVAAKEERTADLADSVAVTGQIVVVRAIVSVTTITPVAPADLAGQFVIDAAQLVIVRMEVV